MAGDWIPIDTTLPSKPEVVRIAKAWGKSCDEIVGMLVRFWVWAQAHTADGRLPGMTTEMLVEVVHVPHRLFDELQKVGWLSETEGGLSIPNFERWLSRGAKRRLLDRDRKRAIRGDPGCPQNVRKMSASKADKMRTTEEKRREEKNKSPTHPLPPPSPQEPGKLRLPRGWECVRGDLEEWLEYLKKHGKYPIDPDLQVVSLCRMFSSPDDLQTAIRAAMANGWVILKPDMAARPPPQGGRGQPEPEPLSATIQRLMQQREETATKPR